MLMSHGGGARGGMDKASTSSGDKSPGRFSFNDVSNSLPS